MSVENVKVIDFASIDKNGKVVLTISDHLKWDDSNEHLLILQNKINAYLSTISRAVFHQLRISMPRMRPDKLINV